MNLKVVFMLAIALFAFVSTIAIMAVTFKVSMPNRLKIMVISSGSGDVQPTGDPVDDPLLPV